MYEKTLALMSKALISLSAFMLLIMTTLVCLQVFYRYVLNAPLTGSEEAARAILIYVVILGSAYGVGKRSHLTISYFYERLPPVLKKFADFLYLASILGIALIFVVAGWELAQRTMFQTTPALRIPKGWIVYAFPIGGALMCLYVVGMLKAARRSSEKADITKSKTEL